MVQFFKRYLNSVILLKYKRKRKQLGKYQTYFISCVENISLALVKILKFSTHSMTYICLKKKKKKRSKKSKYPLYIYTYFTSFLFTIYEDLM